MIAPRNIPGMSSREPSGGIAPQTRSPQMLREEGATACVPKVVPCADCPLPAEEVLVVPGNGPANAPIVFVGGKPDLEEGRAGRPLVGEIGELFDRLLAEAGLDRQQVYVTYAVKHVARASGEPRRSPARLSMRELRACRSWLEAELRAIRPQVLVCLGAPAARALLGPQFRFRTELGHVHSTEWAPQTIATYLPSALLRTADSMARAQIREQFAYDLDRAAQWVREAGKSRSARPQKG